MSRQRIIPLITFALLLPLYAFSLCSVASLRKNKPPIEEVSYVFPSPLLKISALEFDGLASDFLFLKTMSFYGGTLNRRERPRVKEREWKYICGLLNASTDLDPYFFDPYYFAEANLTWEAHMVKEANRILAKGSKARDWDYTIPFFMGFNEFYFLKNNSLASEYLMDASKRPDAPSYLASLSVRFAYEGERTRIAIAFLRETIKNSKNVMTRKELENRLEALEAIYALEQARDAYKSKYGRTPGTLNELLAAGIISRIEKDPFGGRFYLDENGSVKTTSDLRPVKNKN